MYRFTLISLSLIVFVLPCLSQENTKSQSFVNDAQSDCSNGFTGFAADCLVETLDSVIRYEFNEGITEPNLSRKFFYFDQQGRLDSTVERYKDLRYDYTSGNRIVYDYDGVGRISEVVKISTNSSISHFKIVIRETYQYEEGLFRRYSNIEWRTSNDTSSVNFHEEYTYDQYNQLVDYIMFIPREINPDNAIYNETFRYDSIGFLNYERKNLSEAGTRLNVTETQYRNIYMQDSLPSLIHSASRTNELGGWEDVGVMRLFYDDFKRNNLQSKSIKSGEGLMYEKQIYSYDEASNVIKSLRYISTDSAQFQIADSTLYYHAMSEVTEQKSDDDEVEEEVDEAEKEKEVLEAPGQLGFKLFPNPTDGLLHVRSEVDSPSELRIIDASGSVILSRRIQNGVADIDLSPYPDGFYIVMLSSSMGYQTGKVFKF